MIKRLSISDKNNGLLFSPMNLHIDKLKVIILYYVYMIEYLFGCCHH